MLIVGIFSIWRNVGVYLYVNCPNVKDFNNNIHTVNTLQLDSVHSEVMWELTFSVKYSDKYLSRICSF